MTEDYKYGRSQEELIARSLRARGAKVKISPGSRGITDLRVEFPTGTKWWMQVKSTRDGKPASLSSKDLGRLKQSATKSGATPVIAEITRGKVKFKSARSERTLMPRKSKK